MNIVFDLNTVSFVLVGLLFTGYAVLDGFDLGVGALHLFTKTDEQRRLMLNAIGPVWDGNEVWLVTGGGALFAAFPRVYATVFSGFYMAFMIFLFGLIFRAVAIEFRSKEPMKWWRNLWDISFSVSSIVSSFVLGVALGNIIRGIPLDADGEYIGTFWTLINPYAILVGITTVALFSMHGAIYVVMKTEGPLHEKIRGWVNKTIIFFIVCYISTTMITLIYIPHMIIYFREYPILFGIPFINMVAIANIPREIIHRNNFRAFLSSCAAMMALMTIFGIGIFPNLVHSLPLAENSLTIYNAASSPKTLSIILTIAVIGVPVVLAYTVSVYWIFRGKVKLDASSY
ncbi:cytochrome d ubiquinol oxidase subunit II [candidate division KSB1 bacterium]|nr:cytochrome d ubiquinol oxidase subunit II [candidate division KSB1 bacterium]